MADLLRRMREYGRRFTPLLLWRIIRTDPRLIPSTIAVDPVEIAAKLQDTLLEVNKRFSRYSFLKPKDEQAIRHDISALLFEVLHFELARKPSSVCDGSGIFVERGQIKEYNATCLYPGTIYMPGDPVLLQSLFNSFLLRCRSCALRDLGPNVSDMTWLDKEPINFLNQGQYVNDARGIKGIQLRIGNESPHFAGNVQYIDVDIRNWSWAACRWLPYTMYRSREYGSQGPPGTSDTPMRIVALVSTTPIQEGEELLADYLAI